MSGVHIVTDSACDLPEEIVAEHGISIVPLSIRFGDEELIDRVELSTEEFWKRSKEFDGLPETAAPSPGAFEEAFRQAAENGADGVVCVNISRGVSATIEAAELAARTIGTEIPIRVVDSRSITIGIGLNALSCARAAKDGASLDEVAAIAEDLAHRTRVYAALDTLENLKKGGRIGGAQAFVGSLLNIKPIIEVSSGVVESAAKARTRAKSMQYLVDRVADDEGVSNVACLGAATPDVHDLKDRVAAVYDGEIIVGDIGPVIGTHGGLGTLGVVYQVANRIS